MTAVRFGVRRPAGSVGFWCWLVGLGIMALPGGVGAREGGVAHCTSPDGSETRRIAVHYDGDEPVPCQVYYKKYGKDQKIAWANSSPGVCERKAGEVVENLVQADYRCDRQSFGGVVDDGNPLTPADDGAADEPSTSVAETPPVVAPAEAERKEPGPRSNPEPAKAEPIAPNRPVPTLAGTPIPTRSASPGTAQVADSAPPVNERSQPLVVEAPPLPRVLNYLTALRQFAEAGQDWASQEMSAIHALGIDTFYERWETTLFSAFDANHDGIDEWLVRTVDCKAGPCPGYLLQRSAARDDDGLYVLALVMITDTLALEALNCSIPRGQWRPLFARYGERGVAYHQVYERRGELYQPINQCVEESLGAGRANIRWDMREGRRRVMPESQAVRGNAGDCHTEIQALYPSCYVPAVP